MHPTLRNGLLGIAMTLASSVAWTFPTRPVTIVVPAPPGGTADAVVRTVAPRLATALGQPVLVENKPGASGAIASQAVAGAAPDGHTLLMNYTSHAINPWLMAKLPYDSTKSFTPVGFLGKVPLLLAVPADGHKTVAELLADARANPGKLSYGSSATGGASHLGGELFSQLTGTQFSHVPFKVLGELYQAVGNADVHWGFGSIASSQAVFKAGKLRYIAVAAPKRVAAMPDVPTAAEAGGPAALDVNSFVTLLAPKGVPKDITDRMGAEMTKANGDVELKARYDAFAFEPISWGVDEILRAVGAKAATYGELIRRANITLE